jgi:hypothetical protein
MTSGRELPKEVKELSEIIFDALPTDTNLVPQDWRNKFAERLIERGVMLKKDFLQIVIEDVPHKYQRRLLDALGGEVRKNHERERAYF